MTISAFPYIGGKSELAPWIIQHLPNHACYVEPYAGSASVLLNKPRSKVEVLNDLDGDVVQFFRICRDRDQELKDFLKNVPYSRQQYNEWSDAYYNEYRPDDPVERAGRWVYLRYACFGGKYGRKSGYKRSSHLNKQPPSKIWQKVPSRVDYLRRRLRGVEIECLDAHEIIDRYDGPDTVFYCDPPYLEADRDYYQENQINHSKLEDQLSKIEGYAVVSYAELPKAFQDDWVVRDRDYTQRARRGSTAEWNKDAVERICLNYDPDLTPKFVDSQTQQETLTTAAPDGGDA